MDTEVLKDMEARRAGDGGGYGNFNWLRGDSQETSGVRRGDTTASGAGSECDRLASIVIARTYGDPIGAYRFTTRSEYGIETQQQIKWFRLWGRLSELVGNRPIKFIVLDDDEVFEVQFLD